MKLDAITNEIANGSNTKIIINKSTLIIIFIGLPVNSLKYFKGPNSLAISALLSVSKILISIPLI